MHEIAQGNILKMVSELTDPVEYRLPVGDTEVPLNELIGRTLRIESLGEINCIHCGRKTSKSFSQGFCFPCMRKLARCDQCIMKPELCHYFEGTCREPEWGDANCMIDHFVYLAQTSNVKVGITRNSQVPTRWIDQGASRALPVMRVKTRQQSGFAELMFKQHVADKTNWRALFKPEAEPVDLTAERDRLRDICANDFVGLQERFGIQDVQWLDDAGQVEIRYPISGLPEKIVSRKLDKFPLIEGQLTGIRGQYLILDSCVMNLRNHSGYAIRLSTD